MIRVTLLSVLFLTYAGVAFAQQNFNLVIQNSSFGFDAYISGNSNNWHDMDQGPQYSNTPMPRRDQQTNSMIELKSKVQYQNYKSYADFAISPYCGAREENNIIRFKLRANENQNCNPVPNGKAHLIHTAGLWTCLEIYNANHGANIGYSSGMDPSDPGVPKVVLTFGYGDYRPARYAPQEKCQAGADYCVEFKNLGQSDAYIDGVKFYNSGEGPQYNHRTLLSPGTVTANMKWKSDHIGQSGSASYELRDSCHGNPIGQVNLVFNPLHSCTSAERTFRVRNVFTKAGETVNACASVTSSRIGLSTSLSGGNLPVISVVVAPP
jgi:hypothetical protein